MTHTHSYEGPDGVVALSQPMGNGDGDSAVVGGQAVASRCETGGENDAQPPVPTPSASRAVFLPHIRKSIMPIDEATQRKVLVGSIDGGVALASSAAPHSLTVE